CPDKPSSPAVHAVADRGKGRPRHCWHKSNACCSVAAKTCVNSNCGLGTTLIETSTSAPRIPREPASKRDISYPATFFITSPPKCRTLPLASSSLVPNTKSLKAPDAMRRGPDSPLAIHPP